MSGSLTRPTVLIARLDAVGDVLLAGPAIRAVAASASVVLLTGPRGRDAGALLPGVDRLATWEAPWIEPAPALAMTPDHLARLVSTVQAMSVDEAVLLTSFHQSALPLAMALRLAGVRRISAISEDYPGSLLDVRHPDPGDVPEPERALSLARAAGFDLPAEDRGRLAVRRPLPDTSDLAGPAGYVVLHPGTSVPARAWPVHRWVKAAEALGRAGIPFVVTGATSEKALTEEVAGAHGVDLGGRTSLPELADVLDRAVAAVVANTGPAHLAAAVGTPVVSLFAPTVPPARWAPYGVPSVLLGDQGAACRESRATVCPVPGHPCLSGVTARDVVRALDRLMKVPA